MIGERAHQTGFAKHSLFDGVRAHHYNYAYPGEQPEGIWQRIRGGIAPSDKLVVGADVMGHYHIGDNSNLSIKDEIEMQFGKETWLVKVTNRSQNGEEMIRQEGEDETGHHIFGVCLKKIK